MRRLPENKEMRPYIPLLSLIAVSLGASTWAQVQAGGRPGDPYMGFAGTKPTLLAVIQNQPQQPDPLNPLLMLMPMMQGMMNSQQNSKSPPPGTNFLQYEYPDNHTYASGTVGVGHVLNGLCSLQASKTPPTQVSDGDCQRLANALRTEGTCANRALKDIIAKAGSNGEGIGDLTSYCSTYAQMPNKELVFTQVLALLILEESGWKRDAEEQPWVRSDGAQMGGRGLFQIGPNDATKSQFPDCADVTTSNIDDPDVNIKCGSCIALSTLDEDGTMGHGVSDKSSEGMARYFGPMRDGQKSKRNDIAATVNQWCKASTATAGNGTRVTQ